jgi:hypothetical protein
MNIGEPDSQEQVSRLIDFVRAEAITQMSYPPRPVLVVAGEMPYGATEVTLVPLVYISQPQYWGIQVVGTFEAGPHVSQPIAAVPYSVEIALAGITGTEGIEVIGANSTEKIEVPTSSTGG